MLKFISRLFGSQAEEPAAGLTGFRSEDLRYTAESLRQCLQPFGVTLSMRGTELVLDAMRRGMKLEAIKQIREEGTPRLGLKEAKDVVDALDR